MQGARRAAGSLYATLIAAGPERRDLMNQGDLPSTGRAADPKGWSRLMARAQDGDREAYSRLLDEVVPYLRYLAGRRLRSAEDIEDAVQETLLTIHAIRHTYDPRRPFGPWLVAIAGRRITDRVRRRAALFAREVPLEGEHETLSEVHANLYERIWEHRYLRQAVQHLPRAQLQAITLLKLRELSLKEAALESGMSVAALKVAMHRALKTLRAMLVPPQR